MFKTIVRAFGIVGFAALTTASTPARAEDDFPIVGTYTENRTCVGADASVPRVMITATVIHLKSVRRIFGRDAGSIISDPEKERDGDKDFTAVVSGQRCPALRKDEFNRRPRACIVTQLPAINSQVRVKT